MSDSNVFPDGLTDTDKAKREIFLRFVYPDMKDTYKQLMTLISAVFVFSASFSTHPAPGIGWYAKLYHFLPYAFFIAAMLLCSLGYYMLNASGDKATNLNYWSYRWAVNDMRFTTCALRAAWILEISGILFLLGLIFLAIAAIF